MSRAMKLSHEDGYVWAHPTTLEQSPAVYCTDCCHFTLQQDGTVQVVASCDGHCEVAIDGTLVGLSCLPLATLEAAEKERWGETAQERRVHMRTIKTVSALAIQEISDGTGTVCIRFQDGTSQHLRGYFNADRTEITWRKSPCHCLPVLLPDVSPEDKERFKDFVCDERATELVLRD